MRHKNKNPELDIDIEGQPCPDDFFNFYETTKIIRSSEDETEVREIQKYIAGDKTCDGVPISEKPSGWCSVCGLPVSNKEGNFGYCSYIHCQVPLGRRHMRFYRDEIYCPKHYPNIIVRLYYRYIDMVEPK